MKKHLQTLIILLILSVSYTNCVYSQTSTNDSLAQRLELYLNEANSKYESLNYDGAIFYYKAGLDVQKEITGEQHSEYVAILNNLGLVHKLMCHYDNALVYYNQALIIIKELYGTHNEIYASLLNNIGMVYNSTRNYEQALHYCSQALSIRKNILGVLHHDYALTLNNMGWIYKSKGEYTQALDYYTQASDVWKKVLGKQDLYYATSLNNIGEVYKLMGDYNQALEYCMHAMSIRKIALGEQNASYAESVEMVGSIYKLKREYIQSLDYYIQASDIWKTLLGGEHQLYMESLNNIGGIYTFLDDNKKALSYCTQALNIYKIKYGEQDAYYATLLNNIGGIYCLMGEYKEALSYCTQASNIIKEELGDQSEDYINSLSTIGFIYSSLGEYNEELGYYTQACEYYKLAMQTVGDSHPDFHKILSSIIYLYTSLGDYQQVLKYYDYALCVQINEFGRNNSCYGTLLNNKGLVYQSIGDYEKALSCYMQSLNISGEDTSDYAISLNNIGLIYQLIGDYEESLKYHIQALNIQKSTIGEQDPDYAKFLGNIGSIYFSMRNFNKSFRYYMQALDIQKKVLGEDDLDYAILLNNIGLIYQSIGNYEESLKYHTQSLNIKKDIIGEQHPDYAVSLTNMGLVYDSMCNYAQALNYHIQALNIIKIMLRESHPNYIKELIILSCSHYCLGEFSKALEVYLPASRNIRLNALQNFLFMTERQRGLYWKTQESGHNFIYSLILGAGEVDSDYTTLGYNSALFSKGLILASSIEFRKVIAESGDAELMDKYNKMQNMVTQLQGTGLTLEERDSLQLETDRLEKYLVKNSKEYGDFTRDLSLDCSDVEQSLKKNDIAVEFVNFKLVGDSTNVSQYAALVMRSGWKNPKMINLSTESELSKFMANKSKIYEGIQSKLLYKLIWGKLEEYMNEGDNIYFSPAGSLHKINIELLSDNNGVRANKKYNIYRVSSTREVCNKNPELSPKSAILYGGLQYDIDTTMMVTQSMQYDRVGKYYALRGSEADEVERIGWNPLPGTKTEIDNISTLMERNNITPVCYVGMDGNEESFKSLSGKNTPIIHIATHGFFLKDKVDSIQHRWLMPMSDSQSQVKPDNSMKRSGLILAGAQKAWLGEEIPEGVDDGILLSEEIAMLDLRGTDLVVLSACETGLGEITSEGVFGLQRAFKKAGVQTIIMSLWRVDDRATSLMMQSFYKSLLSGKSKRESFLYAQEQVRNEFEEPNYWASFVMLD